MTKTTDSHTQQRETRSTANVSVIKKKKKSKRNKKKPLPLVPPLSNSRRQARKVTTLFHKLSNNNNDNEDLLEELRPAYQRASQVSTAFFSTSRKWVLGTLARQGWFLNLNSNNCEQRRLLEIGAINTQLLTAAERYPFLLVRAIDLHSMHPHIEQADFLTIPLVTSYHVIVCSMVINCVATAVDRGRMMQRLHQFLVAGTTGGLLFLSLPKTCLTQSRYMDRARFAHLLQAVGFDLMESKDTPKIAFFLCRRAERDVSLLCEKFRSTGKVLRRGKKGLNDFDITFPP